MIVSTARFLAPWVPRGLRWGSYAALAVGVLGGNALPHVVPTPNANPVNTTVYPTGRVSYPAPQIVPLQIPLAASTNSRLRVTGVKTYDTGVDISASINAACTAYSLGANCPVGMVALFGTESDIHQYAPHYQMSNAGYCDYSAGLSQITACTAGGLGIGDGTPSSANIAYVFAYEQADPNRDVWLTAKLLKEFQTATCLDFPTLYASWNLGSGYGCNASVYYYPNNPITIQAVANFANWYALAWRDYATYASAPDYKPKPIHRFDVRGFESYRTAHHLRAVPYKAHGHLTWAASIFVHHHRLGGIRNAGRFYRGRPGYDKYVYAHGVAYAFPKTHRYHIRLHR